MVEDDTIDGTATNTRVLLCISHTFPSPVNYKQALIGSHKQLAIRRELHFTNRTSTQQRMIRLVGHGETLRVENPQTSIIRSNIKLAIEISKLGKDMRLVHLLRREKLDDILLFIYIPKAIL